MACGQIFLLLTLLLHHNLLLLLPLDSTLMFHVHPSAALSLSLLRERVESRG
jgi:hypothetical protein